MSGTHGLVMGHLLRRGAEMAQNHFAANPSDAEQTEPLTPNDLLTFTPVIITALLTMVAMFLVKYTIGEVIATLTMIESTGTAVLLEPKSTVHDAEPDSPLEKAPLLLAELDVETDVAVIATKPVTESVRATLTHLRRVGGFFSKWRGLFWMSGYHCVHSAASFILSTVLGYGVFGRAIIYILVSVGLARLHMAWTHSVIAYPSERRRLCEAFVPRKQCKALLLPAFVFAVAQQLTFLIPLGVAFALRVPDIKVEDFEATGDHVNCSALIAIVLRVLAVPFSGLFVAFAVLLPAAVTLTRIEAILLPEGKETIVPFDRARILGSIDLSAKGSCKKVFVEAWRSFDGASRWRLIKVYLKLAVAHFLIALTGFHIILAELYVLGPERFVNGIQLAVGEIEKSTA